MLRRMWHVLFRFGLFIVALLSDPHAVFADVPGLSGRSNFGVTGMLQPHALPLPVEAPGVMCRRAVEAAGRSQGIPAHFMSAIARIESGRRSADGQVNPWPWSINVEGVDHVYDTRDQAVAAVRAFQARGVRSIDVGCMQVNLLHHPNAFVSLEDGFDPAANAGYAGRFLAQLFQQTGAWPKAVAAYHSFTPELGDAYQRKVMAVLAEETRKDLALADPGPGPRHFQPGSMASGGALMLGNKAETARLIPLGGTENIRTLDAYRAAPVRIATKGP
jgi:hypothetical protein